MDLKEIRQLLKMLDGTDVAELEIKEGGNTVRISRALGSPQGAMQPMFQPLYASAPPAQHAPAASAPAPEAPGPVGSDSPSGLAITSPMVGTFYRSSSPESGPFVQEGDVVQKGQVLCIIEAMKLMNEIESELSGRVVRILKDNASPVEYGEELFIIEPA